MKKVLRILLKIVAAILLLVVAAVLVMQSPRVQTYAAEKVAETIRNSTDADLSFKMVSFRPFEAITLDDVVLVDRAPIVPGADTILNIGSFSAKFSLWGFLAGTGAYIRNASLDKSSVCIVMEPDSTSSNGTTTNIQRVFRITDKNKNNFTWGNILSARQVTLTDVNFKLKNPEMAEKMRLRGAKFGLIDFNDLDVTIHYASIRHIKMADDYIEGTVEKLRARENRSWFRLTQASASDVKVGRGSVTIKDLCIRDTYSDLNLNFLRLDGKLKDYSDFINKVRISGDINEGSLLAMKTLTWFAPNIERFSFRGYISGKADGLTNDFNLKDVRVRLADGNLGVKVNGRITDVTDMDRFAMKLKLQGTWKLC